MTIYCINSPHVISEIATDETVIINLETGSYYNLNNEASKLWALFQNGADTDAIKQKLGGEKLDEFLAKLIAEGLVRKTDSAEPQDIPAINTENLLLETYTDMQDLLGLDPIHEVDAGAGWPVRES